MKKSVTNEEAAAVAQSLGITWEDAAYSLEDFRIGMEVEYEHGTRDAVTNVTNDDPLVTGKIAWAHLREYPDYYVRLAKLEREAEEYWSTRQPAK